MKVQKAKANPVKKEDIEERILSALDEFRLELFALRNKVNRLENVVVEDPKKQRKKPVYEEDDEDEGYYIYRIVFYDTGKKSKRHPPAATYQFQVETTRYQTLEEAKDDQDDSDFDGFAEYYVKASSMENAIMSLFHDNVTDEEVVWKCN